MDGKMVLLALGAAVLIALYQVKQYQDFFKFINGYKAEHKVEVQQTGKAKPDLGGIIVALVILGGLAAYSFLRPDTVSSPQNFLLLAAVLAIIFGTSAFTSSMTQQIFYTQTGFFLKGRFVAFSEIKGFERSQKGHILRLKDDSTHILTPPQVIGLDQLYKQGFYTLETD